MKVTPIHEDVVDSTVTARADDAANEPIEEGPECHRRHLAGGHRKFSMANLASARRVTVDPDIVGWVGDYHLGEFAP